MLNLDLNLKVCTGCKQLLARNEFSRHKNGKDGLQSTCRACASRKYNAWRETHRPERAEYMRSWSAANPRIEYDRERYQRDPHVSARRLIQRRVAAGRMPKAADLQCVDCGSPASEYDHYAGYEGEARSMVEAVCFACHRNRTYARKAS